MSNFTDLFEFQIKRKLQGKRVILPISGGLDSRTIAAALKEHRNVVVYSYEFENGLNETKYGKMIANKYSWEFHSFKIPRGYLWKRLIDLAKINQCEVEFTHPRQMAVMEEISQLGDIIVSGSMGDLLFDSFNLSYDASTTDLIQYAMQTIVKPSGYELANELWNHWKLDKDFESELNKRIKTSLREINIDNPISLMRAFKVMNYVKRWTNVNMKVFTNYSKVYAPYHENEICEFVCTLPEHHLSNRKIQIEYIKKRAPELARIPWQDYDLDLYKYKYFNSIFFPRRMMRYAKRIIKENILGKPKIIERNWELQFLGKENKNALEKWLFQNDGLHSIIPKKIISKYYKNFLDKDSIAYSHSTSMLLTLAVWSRYNKSFHPDFEK